MISVDVSRLDLSSNLTELLKDIHQPTEEAKKFKVPPSRLSHPSTQLMPARDNWSLLHANQARKPVPVAPKLQWGRTPSTPSGPSWGRMAPRPVVREPKPTAHIPDMSSILYHKSVMSRNRGNDTASLYDVFVNVLQSGMSKTHRTNRG